MEITVNSTDKELIEYGLDLVNNLDHHNACMARLERRSPETICALDEKYEQSLEVYERIKGSNSNTVTRAELIAALRDMAVQYLSRPDERLCHDFMSAGENCLDVLARLGEAYSLDGVFYHLVSSKSERSSMLFDSAIVHAMEFTGDRNLALAIADRAYVLYLEDA